MYIDIIYILILSNCNKHIEYLKERGTHKHAPLLPDHLTWMLFTAGLRMSSFLLFWEHDNITTKSKGSRNNQNNYLSHVMWRLK